MKDQRDATALYYEILEMKTAWNCTIIEAADRVEKARQAGRGAWSTVVSAPPIGFADGRPQRGEARQKGAQESNGRPEAEAI
jgi:hypothetical protein